MSEIMTEFSNEDIIVFKEFNSLYEAQIVKSLLDSAGIWSQINNELMSVVYPMAIAAQIMVRREDYDRVKALVTA